jgi:hypothetical protein
MSRPEQQKSVTKTETERSKRIRNRARYRCPDGLRMLIDLEQSIPPDRQFPHYQQLLLVCNNDRKLVVNEMKKRLEGISQDYYPGRLAPYKEYIVFREIRMGLRDLANLALVPTEIRNHFISELWEFSEDNKSEYIDTDTGQILADPDHEKRRLEFRAKYEQIGVRFWNHHTEYDLPVGVFMEPPYSGNLEIFEDNRIHARLPKYGLHHLIGVDVSRLRVCEVCDHIFWAKQENSFACGTKCSGTRRQRKLRENLKNLDEARKRKRKRNRKKNAQKQAK